MPDKEFFDFLSQTIGRCETRFERYLIPSLSKPKRIECICKDDNEKKSAAQVQPSPQKSQSNIEEYQEDLRIINAAKNFEALTDVTNIDNPKIVIWQYMTKKELENFLSINDPIAIEQIIEEKLGSEFIKGTCRKMFVELIKSATDFCKDYGFTVEETGSILSIFYLSHRYFTSSLYRTAQEVYNYFKEFLFCVSISCPPESIKLLDTAKSREVLNFFCRIYLRNLPLIRLLCIPNYGFFMDYHVEIDELEELIKEVKNKIKPGKGGKKDKKKGGKKK
ncbi:coiled-coil domain-containing protein 189-like [Agrilus planipennis]|uniref:Coiled-coil domain-containing protein 189-like n=1 Tax=Agrilus planipennis TaxID=224129 RepID=A0A1W4XB91_AGRPL|nr:coiled-coil domain-containing protein 189-like [Agrilus planipennis]